MARQKGMLNLSGNIEVNAGAPFDARDIVPTKADLTVASNFPYAYVGMETYVVAEDKKYRYMGGGVETLSNWVEVGSGGGTTYNDFVGATDLANGVHGLVPAPLIADKDKFLKGDGSWAEIAMPNVDLSNEISGYNIYSTTEKMIGQWTNGKPLYQKTITKTINIPSATRQYVVLENLSSLNIDSFVIANGIWEDGDGIWKVLPCADSAALVEIVYGYPTSTALSILITGTSGNRTFKVTLRYTKTTDTAMPIGTPNDYSTTEKIVGTWIDGKPLYQKTFNTTTPTTDSTLGAYVLDTGANCIIHKYEGYVTANSGAERSLDCYLDVNYYSHAWCGADKHQLAMSVKGVDFVNRPAMITVQYTKTTD